MAPADKEDDLPIEWGWVKEDIIDGLLNLKETSTDLTLVDPDDPADFQKLGKTLLGTLIAVITVGFSAIQNAFFEGLAGYPEGIGSFVDDLVMAVLNIPGNLLATAADTSAAAVESYGMLAFVAGIAVVLAALWIVAQGIEVIR